MAVYVDDYRLPARVGRVSGRWSHLSADTVEELHAFAARLGMRRAWFQDKGDGRWHYDLVDRRREEAIRLGATPITYRSMGAFISARRRGESWTPPRCPECTCDPVLCETDETGDSCSSCGSCVHGCPLDDCPAHPAVR